MHKMSKIVVGSIASLALAGGVGAGIAAADPTSSPSGSPSPTASASATPGKAAHHRPLLRRALHGEVTLAGKKHRVVDFQRGAVTKVSTTSIKVKSADGFTRTYVVDAKTRVRHDKAPAKITDVKIADKVRVVAVKSGATLTAKVIADRTN